MATERIIRKGGMHNPPHPGKVLKKMYMEPLSISVNQAAETLKVARKHVSYIINEHKPIKAEMALRIAKMLNTSPELWAGMQQAYDIYHAKEDHKELLASIVPISADDSPRAVN